MRAKLLIDCWAQLSQESDRLNRAMMIIKVKGAMLNFAWTNHVCKRSLLFRCVWSENSLKYALNVIVSVISQIVNIYAN